jgi:hypothetical protein
MGVWKEIRCDGSRNSNDCYSNLNHGPMGYESAAELRKMARRQGWLVKGGEEVCPVCRKEVDA